MHSDLLLRQNLPLLLVPALSRAQFSILPQPTARATATHQSAQRSQVAPVHARAQRPRQRGPRAGLGARLGASTTRLLVPSPRPRYHVPSADRPARTISASSRRLRQTTHVRSGRYASSSTIVSLGPLLDHRPRPPTRLSAVVTHLVDRPPSSAPSSPGDRPDGRRRRSRRPRRSTTSSTTSSSTPSFSERMSMRHPVRRAARRAFWPSLPMASDSCWSCTITVAMPSVSSRRTSRTRAGCRAAWMNSMGRRCRARRRCARCAVRW